MSRILILIVKIYQRYLSQFTNECLYTPSCSEYFILAIKKYGIRKGYQKFMDRFSRCTPHHIHLDGTEDLP